MAVLWDGNGLVAERIETVRKPRPHRLRPISANPDYTPYNPLREDKVMSGPDIGNFIRNAGGDEPRGSPVWPEANPGALSWRPGAR